MAFIYHTPRKRTSSSEPRVTISKTFISLNPVCITAYFKDRPYAKLGHDPKSNKIIIVPAEIKDKSLTIIQNKNWTQRYINAKKFLADLPFGENLKGEYKCTWDDVDKGIVVDINKDRVTK